METNVIESPGRAEREEALSWPERARQTVITCGESYTAAGELILGIKALRKRIGDVFDPHIKRAFESHRALTREKADAEAPLIEAERLLKERLVTYTEAQERIRREAQRQADEEARRREEDDRLARAAAMETEGQQYGDTGLVAEAHALLEAPPLPVAAAPVPKATPKVAGITMRTDYTCQLDNLGALVQYVAKHPQFLNLLTFNQTAGTALARAQRDQMRVPGLRVVPVSRVAAGGR